MRTATKLIPALAVCATMAACGGGPVSGQAGPPSAAGSSPSGKASVAAPPSTLQNAAPSVPRPLNWQVFNKRADICKIINQNQVNGMGLTNVVGRPPDTDEGIMTCAGSGTFNRWDANFSIAIFPDISLDRMYGEKSEYKLWTPVSVQDYPGVVVGKTDERKSRGSCEMYFSITNQATADIEWDGRPDPTGQVACQKTQQLAGAVMSNLKLQG